jgi:hypothetical protein
MKCHIQKLDRRYSYNDRFQHALIFQREMSRGQGPLHFNHAMQWCVQTWGWSAEVRQYYDMIRWSEMIMNPLRFISTPAQIAAAEHTLPAECNPQWSWGNGMDDLRIYLKSGAELAFFQLAHQVDQK